eukprot:1076286-Amorphochlora_amoeboformis.AAC.1
MRSALNELEAENNIYDSVHPTTLDAGFLTSGPMLQGPSVSKISGSNLPEVGKNMCVCAWNVC